MSRLSSTLRLDAQLQSRYKVYLIVLVAAFGMALALRSMVTPEELYGSGGIRASELIQWSAVNALGYALIKKAIGGIRNARTDAEIDEIRKRIDRELEALRRAKGGG